VSPRLSGGFGESPNDRAGGVNASRLGPVPELRKLSQRQQGIRNGQFRGLQALSQGFEFSVLNDSWLGSEDKINL